jgi:prepilin-type N-terminal cleavage/methylation domain-containing protein
MNGRATNEAGLTLIELLVSIVILGIIGPVLAVALFIGIRTTTESHTSLDQTNGEQFLANYLARDVAAACSPTLVDGPSCARDPNPSLTAGTACGIPVAFALDIITSATGTAADTTIGYALQSNDLVRVTCGIDGSSPSTRTLARKITSVTPSAPTTGSCANQFQLAVVAAGSNAGATYPPYSYVLCAHRRAG